MAEIANAPDLQEQIARINQLLADASRKRQEYRLAPIALAVAGMTAGAALFAAGAAWTHWPQSQQPQPIIVQVPGR